MVHKAINHIISYNDGICESKEIYIDSSSTNSIIDCPNDSLWEHVINGYNIDFEEWNWSCYCINCSFSPIFKK